MQESEYKTFKSAFWAWFDSLPSTEKKRFWYYQQDAAEVFFYNRHWVHQVKAESSVRGYNVLSYG